MQQYGSIIVVVLQHDSPLLL